MSTLETRGSFNTEPDVSEAALATKLVELVNALTPDEKTTIIRTLSLNDSGPVINRDLFRAKKELQAALRHKLRDNAILTFGVNPKWGVCEVREVQAALDGTEEINAKLVYDQDSHSFHAHLEDSSGEVLPRDDVQVSTVQDLLHALGIPSYTDLSSQAAFSDWLNSQMQSDQSLYVLQRHTIYQRDYGNGVAATCEVEKEQTISPDELITVTRFITTTLTDVTSHARILQLFNSDVGNGIGVEEVSRNEITGEVTRRTPELDYELIEKLLRHIRAADATLTG